MPVVEDFNTSIPDHELEVRTTRGSGPGGQHRNKVETEVIMTHIPTGIQARCGTKSQYQNKILCKKIILARLEELNKNKIMDSSNSKRREQIGSGLRGDKIRTVKVQEGIVKCEITGKTMSYNKYVKGFIEI